MYYIIIITLCTLKRNACNLSSLSTFLDSGKKNLDMKRIKKMKIASQANNKLFITRIYL